MKGLTKQHFTMRCKLRGTIVEVVVMDKSNDDVYALSWDFTQDVLSFKGTLDKESEVLEEENISSEEAE